jgi:hypothetical protein
MPVAEPYGDDTNSAHAFRAASSDPRLAKCAARSAVFLCWRLLPPRPDCHCRSGRGPIRSDWRALSSCGCSHPRPIGSTIPVGRGSYSIRSACGRPIRVPCPRPGEASYAGANRSGAPLPVRGVGCPNPPALRPRPASLPRSGAPTRSNMDVCARAAVIGGFTVSTTPTNAHTCVILGGQGGVAARQNGRTRDHLPDFRFNASRGLTQ